VTKEKKGSKHHEKKITNKNDDPAKAPVVHRREFSRLCFDLKPHFGPSTISKQNIEIPPWCPKDARYLEEDIILDRMKAVGAELNHFCKWIELKPKQLQERVQLADRLKEIAVEIWPQCQMEIFGSVAYNLSLPSSDVDLMLSNCEMTPNEVLQLTSPLDKLLDALDGEEWIKEKKKDQCDGAHH